MCERRCHARQAERQLGGGGWWAAQHCVCGGGVSTRDAAVEAATRRRRRRDGGVNQLGALVVDALKVHMNLKYQTTLH